MFNLLRKFRKDTDGTISVEFAMIAPMLIFGSLFAIDLGYQVNKQQKVEASLAAGSNYLQDFALGHNMNELRPNYDSQTGKVSDTEAISTVKQVIEKASGGMVNPHEINIDVYCACPNNKVPDDGGIGTPGENFEFQIEQPISGEKDFDFTDPTLKYYTKTNMSLFRKGELCAFNCPDNGGRARVIAEMDIQHVMNDLFGKETTVRETLLTRIR